MCDELACLSGACGVIGTKTRLCVWHWSSVNMLTLLALSPFIASQSGSHNFHVCSESIQKLRGNVGVYLAAIYSYRAAIVFFSGSC